MAITALPVVSDRIFLRDLLLEVAALEGECKADKRAYSIARQCTEGDHRQVAQMYSERRVRWTEDSIEEVRDANLRDEWAWHVFLCTCDVGNVYGNDKKPIFKFTSGPIDLRRIDMPFDEFLVRFGMLNTSVARALRYAVWSMNPEWDQRRPVTANAADKQEEEDPGE